MNKKVLIILPSYNEEESLPILLKQLKEVESSLPYAITPIVVNDCSKDETSLVAKNLGVRVLDLVNNLGIGGAVQTGIQYAKENDYDYAMQMDGDGQHPPTEIHKLVNAAISENADIVIGSRFLNKEGFQSSFIRRLGIKYFHLLNRILTGTKVYDSTSGFRLLSRKAIAIAATNYPDDYPEPESLVIFSKAKLKIVEVPVVMSERLGGKSSIGAFSSLYYFIKVTLSMIYSYVKN